MRVAGLLAGRMDTRAEGDLIRSGTEHGLRRARFDTLVMNRPLSVTRDSPVLRVGRKRHTRRSVPARSQPRVLLHWRIHPDRTDTRKELHFVRWEGPYQSQSLREP